VGRGDAITVVGLVCGQCGIELLPNAKSYNESAVPSYRVRWTDSPPHLAAALPDFLLPRGGNLLRMSVLSGGATRQQELTVVKETVNDCREAP
jgi:hypothetical protein